MIWPDGLAHQLQVRFCRRPVPFPIVARNTGAHEILPGIRTSTGLRNDMIDRQGIPCTAAILTPVIVAPQNILTRENDFFVRNTHVHRKTDDTRERHRRGNRPQHLSLERFYQLGFAEPQQNNGFPDVADAEWLIIVIENQHLPIQSANCANSSCFDAEDLLPPFIT